MARKKQKQASVRTDRAVSHAGANPVAQAGTKPPEPAEEKNSPGAQDEPAIAEKHLWEFTWARDVLIIAVIGLVLLLVYMSRAILIPVLVGLVLAYIFNPIITWAHVRLKVPRIVAVSVLLASLAIAGIGLVLYFGPLAVKQTTALVNTTISYTNKLAQEVPAAAQLRDRLLKNFRNKTGNLLYENHDDNDKPEPTQTPDAETQPGQDLQSGEGLTQTATVLPSAASESGLPIVNTTTQPTGHPAETQPSDTQPAGTQPADTQPASKGFTLGSEFFDTLSSINWPAVFTLLLGSLNLGMSVVGYTFGVIGYSLLALALIAFCFFTFSVNFERVIETAACYVPKAYRQETFRIVEKMDATIAAIIRGRLIQAAALMVMLSFGWCLADVPYWLLLGVVAGALNLLPYAASVGLPAAVCAVWVNRATGGLPFDPMAIFFWPSLVYFISQFIDGWVIEPWVQGKATNFSPLTVLLAVLVGASVAGLAGMLLAIPVAACLKIFYEEFVEPRVMTYLHQDAQSK